MTSVQSLTLKFTFRQLFWLLELLQPLLRLDMAMVVMAMEDLMVVMGDTEAMVAMDMERERLKLMLML